METNLKKKLSDALNEKNTEEIFEVLQTLLESKLGLVVRSTADGILYVFLLDTNQGNVVFEVENNYSFLVYGEETFSKKLEEVLFDVQCEEAYLVDAYTLGEVLEEFFEDEVSPQKIEEKITELKELVRQSNVIEDAAVLAHALKKEGKIEEADLMSELAFFFYSLMQLYVDDYMPDKKEILNNVKKVGEELLKKLEKIGNISIDVVPMFWSGNTAVVLMTGKVYGVLWRVVREVSSLVK